MIGKRFGRLVVLSEAERNKCGSRRWLCQCDCGEQKAITGNNLSTNQTTSCGCFQREGAAARKLTHGMRHTKIYKVWHSMLERCHDTKNQAWIRYGGRGIKVCESWKSFENFIADMGNTPFAGAQIDRENNNGDYEPSNCRWATGTQNARNKSNNHLLEYEGQTKCLSEWAESLGMTYSKLKSRINKHNWSVERAFSTP